MSSESGTRSRTPASSPIRAALAQSRATRTRSSASAGSSRRRSARFMNPYSSGSAPAPPRYITLSLPSSSRASFVARIDPSASPSGFSCVTSRKRSFARRASATACSSVVVVGELIDQLRHAHAALDRRIVRERQLRGPLQAELSAEPSLQDAVGGGEPVERGLALTLRAKDAHEDPGL